VNAAGHPASHPANPARPFRGAGLRAGSGGLAAAAAAGPGGGEQALAGFYGRDGRAAGPTAPQSPEASPGLGWGGPLTAADRATSKDCAALGCRAVTLSNENALSRFRAWPDPLPPACGPQRAAHGPGQGFSGRMPSPTLEPMRDLRRPLAYPLATRTTHSRWLCPSWGQSAAVLRPTGPLGERCASRD
jgi:hypothetical protein